MLGSFELLGLSGIGSCDILGPFELVVSFEPVGSFIMVGPFQPFF